MKKIECAKDVHPYLVEATWTTPIEVFCPEHVLKKVQELEPGSRLFALHVSGSLVGTLSGSEEWVNVIDPVHLHSYLLAGNIGFALGAFITTGAYEEVDGGIAKSSNTVYMIIELKDGSLVTYVTGVTKHPFDAQLPISKA